MNDWARSEGHAGPRLCHPQGRRVRRPDRQEPRRGRHGGALRRAGPRPGRRLLLRRRQGRAGRQAGRRGAHPRRRAARPDRQGRFKFCWIVDFPMSTNRTRTTRRSISRTTRSRCRRAGWKRWRRRIRSTIKAYQYDIVCNGYELSSGSIRNQPPDMMVQGVRDRRLQPRPMSTTQFRRHVSRLPVWRAAAWRHGGRASTAWSCCCAASRTCAKSSLFPMNQRAEDLMMGAPSPAEPKQLRELNIRMVEQPKG